MNRLAPIRFQGRGCLGTLRVAMTLLGAGAASLWVSARAGDYRVIHHTISAGGGHSQSVRYTVDSVLGGFGGMAGGGSVTVRQGYAGELNDGSSAHPDVVARTPGHSVKIHAAQLLANDTDPDNDVLTLLSVSSTTSLGVSLTQDGPWWVYPAAAGLTNTDAFTYVASDGFGWVTTGTVEVQVKAPNAARTYNILGIQLSTDPPGVSLRFVGIPGRTYLIQATADPATPNWVTLGEARADATGLYFFADTAGPLPPGRYYRSVSP